MRYFGGYGMEIGRILKYYRTLHNLTQSEVAELSGINEKYLGRIERNESVPTIDKVEQLCLAFDIRLSDMLMISPDKAMTQKQAVTEEHGNTLILKTVYYCNCCGFTFQSALSDSRFEDIRCPECGCIFDPNNGYIEKSIVY